ncbi:MAG: TonB-dependent receptor [Gemmatimonadetes bacterium]|nr:TonB-dependent receptor [Gemmatimonadota bacterium]
MDEVCRAWRQQPLRPFSSGSIGWALSDEARLSATARWEGDLGLRSAVRRDGETAVGIADDYAPPLARFRSRQLLGRSGHRTVVVGQPDLKWETTREFDVGVDFRCRGAWESWLTTAKKIDDPARSLTSTSGFTSVYDNIGNIENRGWEFQLSTEPAIRQSTVGGLSWSSDFQPSQPSLKNEVTALYRNEPFNAGNPQPESRGSRTAAWRVSQTLRLMGVDPQTGDAIHDDAQRRWRHHRRRSCDRVGSPQALDYLGGFTNTIPWKGFDFRSFVQFTQGEQVFNAIRIFADDGKPGFRQQAPCDSYEKRRKKPGRHRRAAAPELRRHLRRDVSSRFVEDGSYVRLQELTLGYHRLSSAAPSWARTFNPDAALFFVSGRNPVTWTDYTGYNPTGIAMAPARPSRSGPISTPIRSPDVLPFGARTVSSATMQTPNTIRIMRRHVMRPLMVTPPRGRPSVAIRPPTVEPTTEVESRRPSSTPPAARRELASAPTMPCRAGQLLRWISSSSPTWPRTTSSTWGRSNTYADIDQHVTSADNSTLEVDVAIYASDAPTRSSPRCLTSRRLPKTSGSDIAGQAHSPRAALPQPRKALVTGPDLPGAAPPRSTS